MTVLKQPSGNTIDITDQIDEAVEELRSSLPSDITINDNYTRKCQREKNYSS